MKININYAFLCDQAFLSADGKLNVTGIFDEIKAHFFPVVHPQLYVVCHFNVDTEGSVPYLIKVVKIDGEEIFVSEKVNLSSTKTGDILGNIYQLTQIKFETEGKYEVQIYINDTLERALPLVVRKI